MSELPSLIAKSVNPAYWLRTVTSPFGMLNMRVSFTKFAVILLADKDALKS